MRYQTKSFTAPDSDYLDGHIQYLVEHNKGRFLDDRRTPGEIVEVDSQYALFYWKILDFEDVGTVWEMPFEAVANFQFKKDSHTINKDMQKTYTAAIKNYKKKLHIKLLAHAKTSIEHEITTQTQKLMHAQNLCFDHCTSLSALFEMKNVIHDRFQDYLTTHNLASIEQKTSEMIVSNPYAGEWLKHLFIALAEAGLVEYYGWIPKPLKGIPSPYDFEQYLIKRLAFIRALFLSNAIATIPLYRGMSSPSPWMLFPKAFSSWSSEYAVAKELAEIEEKNEKEVSYIFKRKVHIDEIFMTCLETSAMNKKYDEKEFLLLYRPERGIF